MYLEKPIFWELQCGDDLIEYRGISTQIVWSDVLTDKGYNILVGDFEVPYFYIHEVAKTNDGYIVGRVVSYDDDGVFIRTPIYVNTTANPRSAGFYLCSKGIYDPETFAEIIDDPDFVDEYRKVMGGQLTKEG